MSIQTLTLNPEGSYYLGVYIGVLLPHVIGAAGSMGWMEAARGVYGLGFRV